MLQHQVTRISVEPIDAPWNITSRERSPCDLCARQIHCTKQYLNSTINNKVMARKRMRDWLT